ncbi:MAG TPA: fused MFS/spermidine synthase [Longimicrobiaceae bacterium]
MADSFPERPSHRRVLFDAGVAGVALGAIALAGGSLVLYQTAGLLLATAGLIATLVVALLVGLWVSAPAREMEDPLLRERWLVAAVSVAVAGVFASYLQLKDGALVGAVARVAALLLLSALPAYSLAMVLPVLLVSVQRRSEADAEEPEELEVAGRVVAGTLGGVAIGVVLSGLLILQGVSPGAVLLGTSVLVLAPMLGMRSQETKPKEKVIFEADTPFHTLRVTEVVYPGERQPERRLYVNGEEESGELVRSGAPTLAYVAAAEVWLAERTPRGASYLFLGGGAYTLPRRVAERDPDASITVVELDPEVTRAAYHFFGARTHHGMRSVHGDARAFLSASDEAEFDRIFVDVYGGSESLPYSLVTQEAIAAMRDRLRSGGIAAMNVIGTVGGYESTRFWSIVHTFASVFPSVGLYVHLGSDFPDRQNVLLAGAVEEGYDFSGRAGMFEYWPRREWPDVPGAIVYHDLGGSEGMDLSAKASSLAMAKGEQ